MTDQIIRTFSETEQAMWDAWLTREIRKMLLDPESTISIAVEARCEVLLQQIEKDTSTFVNQQIDALRAELTTQQDEREKTWLQKLMTW